MSCATAFGRGLVITACDFVNSSCLPVVLWCYGLVVVRGWCVLIMFTLRLIFSFFRFSGLAIVPPSEREEKKTTEKEYASQVVHGRGVFQPFYHPRTHNIPVAVLHFRSYTPSQLDLFTHFASHAAASLAIPISQTVCLPTQRSLWTVPKGPFAHKKTQENFERKVHKRVIKAWDADEEVIDRWFKYLQRHMLAGIGMRTIKWQRIAVETVTDQKRSGSLSRVEKVRALSDKIILEETRSSVIDNQ